MLGSNLIAILNRPELVKDHLDAKELLHCHARPIHLKLISLYELIRTSADHLFELTILRKNLSSRRGHGISVGYNSLNLRDRRTISFYIINESLIRNVLREKGEA
jgi:hypothetical protein